MPGVCEVICVRGDAVSSRPVEVGRRKRCRFGGGLTRKQISDCVDGFIGIVERVLGFRRRSHIAVSQLDGCCCVL
jgi:hypothetical protein